MCRLYVRDMPMVVRLLLAMDVLFALAHVANFSVLAHFDRPRQMLDLGSELNLPTWFASVQLALLGLLLSGFAYVRRRPRDVSWWAMLVLALVPYYLSVDEFAQLHERLAPTFRSEALAQTGLWMVVAVPAFIIAIGILGLASAPYWSSAPRSSRTRLAAGVGVYIVSAGVLEALSNLVVPYTVGGHVQVVAEEIGELVGVTLMVWGALGLLTSSGVQVAMPAPAADSARKAGDRALCADLDA